MFKKLIVFKVCFRHIAVWLHEDWNTCGAVNQLKWSLD